MRSVIFSLLVFPLVTSAAPYPYTMSGDRFVEMMRPPDLKGYEYLNREKAYSYLDGVRDSSEGRVWCDVDQLKTPDLAYEMAGLIAKMSATERKKNASLLLLELLKRTYPCRKGEAS